MILGTSNPANFRQPALFSSDHVADVLKNGVKITNLHMCSNDDA
jgi:hypothetical protein